MKRFRLLIVVVLAAAVAAFLVFDLGQYLSLEYFKSRQAAIDALYRSHPLALAASFFALYIAVTGLSLPGAALMTIAAGAIFGLVAGTLIVSFASAIGATVAFLVARFVLRDAIQARFAGKLAAINRGVEKDGALYLLTLRLVPAVPFFVINLAMALTPIRTWTFYWMSQLGMLLGTLVYVNAGTEIARLTSLSGIASPRLIAAFTLLGIFPLIARRIIASIEARKVYRNWPRPRRFDCNLVVIGAGSAGLVAAYIAAAVKARVTLIEQHRMGGDCLNTGCVPSKALIRSAKLLSHMRRAHELGIRAAHAEFDFAEVMHRVQSVIAQVAPHDSVERYQSMGVEVIEGAAKMVSPWVVEVTTPSDVRRLTTRAVVIAAGARPSVPPIPGLAQVGYLTSENLWELRELPRRLLVLGGGPIGSELAQCFARFGSKVTQVEILPRLLMREDAEVSETIARRFREEGIEMLLEHEAKRFVVEDGEKTLIAEHRGRPVRIVFDTVLVAVGRTANTEGYGLEQLGIATTAQHTVETNEYLQTLYPNIYACGDVAGPFHFTHTAAHQAWYAAVNALFGSWRRLRVDYSVIPWATFTDPEVARVGLNEQEARDRRIAFEVTRYDLRDLDRAIADGEAHGMVKVLTVPGKDRILGVTIVGAHAADMIAEFIMAMKHGIGLDKILGTIHVYPTASEANKHAAGVWKRAHAPQRLLAWLKRYHAWIRG